MCITCKGTKHTQASLADPIHVPTQSWADMDEMEDIEDDSMFPLQQSRSPSTSHCLPSGQQLILYEVCKRVTSKLGIQWLAALDAKGAERDMTVRGSHQPNCQQNKFSLQYPPV